MIWIVNHVSDDANHALILPLSRIGIRRLDTGQVQTVAVH